MTRFGKQDFPPQWSEAYLGDGVYASCDGFQICLRAPRSGSEDHRIYLEPSVLRALIEYHESLLRGGS